MMVKRHKTGSSIISALCNPSEMNLDREAISKIFVKVGYRRYLDLFEKWLSWSTKI
jgi:hypothetical protein